MMNAITRSRSQYFAVLLGLIACVAVTIGHQLTATSVMVYTVSGYAISNSAIV